MSLRDDPDAAGFGRPREPLDPGRAPGGLSHGPGAGGGLQANQIDPKLLGLGCLIPSVLLIFAGCVGLMAMALVFVVPARRVNRYVENSCVVVDRRIDTQMVQLAARTGGGLAEATPAYRPSVRIRYAVNGRDYEVWAHDTFGAFNTDKAAVQARLELFRVGATYPCWYDPDRPEEAVLDRGRIRDVYGWLILPIIILTVGVIGVVVGWRILASKPATLAPGQGRLPDEVR